MPTSTPQAITVTQVQTLSIVRRIGKFLTRTQTQTPVVVIPTSHHVTLTAIQVQAS